MNYSQVGISNMALGRIGARGQITSVNDSSPNAVKILAVWDMIFQEVLAERDWKFAKTRTQLQLSPVTPLYSYRYAWALPADLLRFVRPIKRPDRRFPCYWGWSPNGWGWYRRDDPPFWPGVDYKIETLTAGWLVNPPADPIPYPPPFPTGPYAITDYSGTWCGVSAPAMITYIQLISDYTQLMPGFVNCLCNRLAMELSINITEDKSKFQIFEDRYKDSLNSSEAQNECLDFSEDESGSTTWQDAGRYVSYW